MTIIERIEQLNAERGWSLYELSKRQTLQRLLFTHGNGKINVRQWRRLRKYARAMGLRCISSSLISTARTTQKNKIS